MTWPAITPILGRYFGEIRPASTAIMAGLVDPRVRIEIEVTARKPSVKRKRAPSGKNDYRVSGAGRPRSTISGACKTSLRKQSRL
jgi:hypothetical protein